jgi:Tfp pilus assembly protein PilV
MIVRANRAGGFVLILAVITMAMVAIAALVLAETSATMLFQTDRVYLEAVQRNLAASGLAWARQNTRSLATGPGKVVELDTGDMRLRDSSLSIRADNLPDGAVDIRVTTSCKKGRQTLSHSDRHTIPVQ